MNVMVILEIITAIYIFLSIQKHVYTLHFVSEIKVGS